VNKLSKILSMGLGFGVVVMALSLIPKPPVKAAVPPPTFTINPIPVNVQNTPLPATISGTANVNVTNTSLPFTGSVALSGNTAVNPLFVRNVDEPARHPFAQSCFGVSFCYIHVPAGVELVITSISSTISGAPTQKTEVFQVATDTGGFALYPVFATLVDSGVGQPNFTNFLYSAPANLYADPGSAVTCQWTEPNGFNPQQGACFVGGYTVGLP
jgi:hypothetical protein